MQCVKVGPFRYSVRRSTAALKRIEQQEGMSLAGWTDHANGQIILRSTKSRDYVADTLLHEILHAVFFVAQAGLPHKREEKTISRITPVLLAVLRDNPELITYLQEQQ